MNEKELAVKAAGLASKSLAEIKAALASEPAVAPDSIHKTGGCAVMVVRDSKNVRSILAAGTVPAEFKGKKIAPGAVLCKLDAGTAAALRKYFPWTAPKSLRKERTTIGCGDRLGLATRGHLRAVKQFPVSPVLAQQSMRELTMTHRTFQGVVDDACFMVYESDFQSGYGADGDHLKKIADIDVALAAGMPMITLDLSEVMNAAAGSWSDSEIDSAFAKLPAAEQKTVLSLYAGKTVKLETSSITISEATAKRCAVMYNAALRFAKEVYEHLKARRGDEFDLEISIDETTSPTLPEHHYYIAQELARTGVIVSSLAPRFIGEFQKAIDYIGDLAEFDRQFKVHAEIARKCGNYKVSVHSGSDKFSVYPTVGRETRGWLHLKTAGTSWLVAVSVIAKHDPKLYRDMHKCSLEHFNEMLKLYHITADITKIPALDTLSDSQLPALMEMPEARQLLHINYGPILTGPLRKRFFDSMRRYEKEYDAAIEAHFVKHLTKLGVR